MMPSPDSQEKDVSELLSKCENALVSRNFEEAISGCRAVLTISPENQKAKALMDEAQSKLEAELFARENIRKAQEFFKLRNFEKCINECQKVLLLDPDNAECMSLMNEAQQKKEAEPFVQNFISSGRSLYDSGLYNEAVAQWEKVRSIDPNYPDLDRLINNAKQMMASPVASTVADEMSLDPIPEFEATQQLPPASMGEEGAGGDFGFISDQQRISQLLKEGDDLYAEGQYQKAIEVWSEIFMLDVNHPDALRKIEEARSAAGQQKVKLKDVLKSAQAAYEQGNVEEAQELFSQVKAQDPENSEANKYLSLIEKSEPSSMEDLIARGDSAEQQGKYREAAQYFSQALAIDSENAQLADRIKNLNLLAKKSEQGKTLLGNARGFVAEGKLDSARHALSKVLESDPANQEALDLLRQIKDSVATGSGAAPMSARTAVPAAARKKLPIIPIAIGVTVLVLGGVFWYLLYGGDDESTQVVTTPIKRPVRTPTAATPGANNTATKKGAAAPANENATEKSQRLVREADFYFHEKHYEDSLKKAEEALKEDPTNKDAIGLRLQSQKMIQDQIASERKLLDDANNFFGYSDFAGAVKLYEQYIDKHPEAKNQIQPQVIKCYFNLGVIAIREWRCDTAADYFRQVLFIDETDQLSKDALAVARKCQKSGTTDFDVRKAVALMEMRR